MHDELEILDVETGAGTFRIVFEVPGEPHGQPYPKRLRHSFPLQEKWMEEVELESGETVKRFEKYLVDNYVDTDEEEKEKREKAREKVEGVKPDVRGRKHGR